MNKFKVKFGGDGEYGWLGFCIYNNNKLLNFISISSVYNPFNEYIEILEKLKKGYKKKLVLEIDQEGIIGILEFQLVNNNTIVFQTKTDVSDYYRKKYNLLDDSQKILFNKDMVIKEMKNKLIKHYLKNKKTMDNDNFYLGFDLNRLKRI